MNIGLLLKVFILIVNVLWIVLLVFYIYFLIIDMKVVFNNYNFPRAEKCNWTSCGLYYHDEGDPQSKDCLSPMVSLSFFKNRSSNGNKPGCKYSIQVREIGKPRKPAEDYLDEYLKVRNSFDVSKKIWRIVAIIVMLLGLLTGVLGVKDFIKYFPT